VLVPIILCVPSAFLPAPLNSLPNSLVAALDQSSRCFGSFNRSHYSTNLPVSSSITVSAYLYACWAGMKVSSFPLWESSMATAFPNPIENFDGTGILDSVLQYSAFILRI
jgi:hypothetical protein